LPTGALQPDGIAHHPRATISGGPVRHSGARTDLLLGGSLMVLVLARLLIDRRLHPVKAGDRAEILAQNLSAHTLNPI
jgi:hypothetical protein